MPTDYKFKKQINSVISKTTGTRTMYATVDGGHVFDAFKVFALGQWIKKDFNATPKLGNSNNSIGVSSWTKPKQMNIDKIKWRKIIENKEELQITKEEYIKGFKYFLILERVRFSLEGKIELFNYLENEIKRLEKSYE